MGERMAYNVNEAPGEWAGTWYGLAYGSPRVSAPLGSCYFWSATGA